MVVQRVQFQDNNDKTGLSRDTGHANKKPICQKREDIHKNSTAHGWTHSRVHVKTVSTAPPVSDKKEQPSILLLKIFSIYLSPGVGGEIYG